jgi:hypothetical protein
MTPALSVDAMETERTEKVNTNSVSAAAKLAQIEAYQPKTPLGSKLWEIC